MKSKLLKKAISLGLASTALLSASSIFAYQTQIALPENQQPPLFPTLPFVPAAQTGDIFGQSVAFGDNGNTMVVGIPRGYNRYDLYEGGATVPVSAGEVHIYTRLFNEWVLTQVLKGALDGENNPFPDLFGSDVAIDGNTLAIGSDLHASAKIPTVYIFERDSNGVWARKAKFPNTNGMAIFNVSVSVSNNIVALGGPIGSRPVKVFEKDANGSWSFSADLFPSSAGSPQSSSSWNGYGYDVLVDGQRVYVGAPENGEFDNKPDGPWGVYVFEKTVKGWQETAKLNPTDPAADPLPIGFGASLAARGNTLIVGSPSTMLLNYDFVATDQLNETGAAYVFEKNANGWQQTHILRPTDPSVQSNFGVSVAIQDDEIAVGANGDNFGNFQSIIPGAVYLFEQANGHWNQTKKIIAEQAYNHADSLFGTSIDLAGDNLAVGALFYSAGNTSQQGSVYVESPKAFDDTYDMPMGGTLKVFAPGVMDNDELPAGATTKTVSVPAFGTVVMDQDGSFVYQPVFPNFMGNDSFLYAASTKYGAYKAKVDIRIGHLVWNINDGPGFEFYTGCPIDYGYVPVIIQLEGITAKTDLRLVEPPRHGQLKLNVEKRQLEYTAAADFVGVDHATFAVTNISTGQISYKTLKIETLAPQR